MEDLNDFKASEGSEVHPLVLLVWAARGPSPYDECPAAPTYRKRVITQLAIYLEAGASV